MIKPDKLEVNINHQNFPGKIANYIIDCEKLEIHFESSIDLKSYRPVYYEPTMLIMTEKVFYGLTRFAGYDPYTNFHYFDDENYWKFMNLPVSVMKEKTKKSFEEMESWVLAL